MAEIIINLPPGVVKTFEHDAVNKRSIGSRLSNLFGYIVAKMEKNDTRFIKLHHNEKGFGNRKESPWFRSYMDRVHPYYHRGP